MVISFVQWMMLGMLSFFHPHHVSTTTVEFNSADKTLEISVKLFADDLEKSLAKLNKGKVDVLNKDEHHRSAKLINQYVSQHLRLEIDGKKAIINFIGFEDEKGNVLAYFEVTQVNSVAVLTIHNTLLREIEKEQVNIIQAKANGKSKTASLKYPATEYIFNLK
jgi:hypothetical protein